MSTGNLNDGLIAMKDGKMIVLRVPYSMGFYAKGFDGRIDDAEAGWKGRGLWTTSGNRMPWLKEGAKARDQSSCTSSFAPIHWRTSAIQMHIGIPGERSELQMQAVACYGPRRSGDAD